MELRDKKIWLIGASSGLGAALIPLLVEAGGYVAISARREDALQELASRHRIDGREILVHPLDVTDGAAVQSIANALWAEWSGIDIVIYNSGAWQLTDITDFEAEAALQQVDVNFLGLIRVAGAVVPRMIQRETGELVGVASLSGVAGFPRAAAYSSSKAGAIAFLQSLRIDLAAYGIGVTTVNPGFFESQLTARNRFRMPFLMTAEAAAVQVMRGLKEGKQEISFPWQLALLVKLFGGLPRPVYEFLARRFMTGRS